MFAARSRLRNELVVGFARASATRRASVSAICAVPGAVRAVVGLVAFASLAPDAGALSPALQPIAAAVAATIVASRSVAPALQRLVIPSHLRGFAPSTT